MTDGNATQKQALARLRKAAARVRRHDAERQELIEAIVQARLANIRPAAIEDIAPWDRNHIGRIVKKDGRVPLREPKRKTPDA